MRSGLIVLVILIAGCTNKNSLTDNETAYVHTTLSLMHMRAVQDTLVDSSKFNRELDSIYRSHHTTKAAFIKATENLGKDPKRAELVYNAIRDSVGIK